MEPIDQLSPSVKLYLLGAPRLEQNGVPITIDRRKAVALLAYLVLTGQTHLRDTLATLLWPDSGQSHARANLRHTLVVLKQALGDDSLDIAWESVARRPEAALWVDVLHFQALLMACRAHDHPPSDGCAVCLPLLTEAVALPAEQFMAGFSLTDSPAFDDWQRGQQQQLTQALSDALDCLVRYFTQTGDYKRAIAYAQRRLGLDSLDEAAQRQLIQLYVWSGQQGLALRQFEQCTSILAQELGVAPSAETVRLIQEIRAGRATAPAPGLSESASHRPPSVAEAAWRPAATPRHNLPLRQQPLIGRDQDLRAVQALLQRATVNLVTLIGPGGVGKTQLSIQLAAPLLDHFADGVFFVSLAPLRAADQMISALAQTWHLPEQTDRPLLERVQMYLRHKQMLLILDNFEHLMAAAPAVSALLANCAHLRIVVTSRELLNVQGEHLYSVSPLSLPEHGQQPTVAAVAKATAVQLFVQRAQAIMPSFVLDEANAADIADICMHLDGLPLAIELVAARIRLLSPRTLRQRLLGAASSSFELLQSGARDAPLRHRTLKDAIAWSYDLLTAAEQWLFRRLAVFVGGCTLEAVERVSEVVRQAGIGSVLDGLASLVNKSLVQQVVQPDGESRFLLLEMIREYALEQLQANDDFATATGAHAETYATFAETAAPALTGPDHLTWIAHLNADHNNCRAALDWAISHQHAKLGLRLSGALWGYWLDRGFYREGRRFLSNVLQLEDAASPTPARARALTGLGALSWTQGDLIEARTCLQEAVDIYRAWGDERGLATALENLAKTAGVGYYLAQANVYGAEAAALYAKVNDRVGLARIDQGSAFIKYMEGDYKTAQVIFEQTLAIYREQQYEAGLGDTLYMLGRILFQQQNFARANHLFVEALQRAQARGDQGLVAELLYFMGRVAWHQAEYVKARTLFEESLRIGRELGVDAANIAFSLAFLGDIALAQGELTSAQTLLRESLTFVQQANDPYTCSLILARFAGLAATLGQSKRAVQLVAAGRSLYQTLKFHLPPNDQMAFDAPLATARRSLSPEQFDQAWAAGEQMAMDAAIALALAEDASEQTSDTASQSTLFSVAMPNGRRHNLPAPLTSLVGRTDDCRAICALLQRSEVRLVTLTGPGGVGKTRLSTDVAATLLDHFGDGVFFVSLAPLHEPELVITAIAQIWSLQSSSHRPALESVKTYLHNKELLLVLDNFEHLVSAAPRLTELLAACARLKILVTSREVLHVQGELVYPTPPLALPTRAQLAAPATLGEVAAIQLFVQRAQAVKPGFLLNELNAAAVSEICRRLDGLPLAIELAAARSNLLPPQSLLQRLQDASSSAFQLLQSGRRDAPQRQQTLRAAIAWSYQLLNQQEQHLFRHLAIFWGGCTLEAVEQINAFVEQTGVKPEQLPVLEVLASLINKSLVQQVVQPDGEPRFLLLETLREYALAELHTSGEQPALARGHAEFFIRFAAMAENGLLGADHLLWVARLNADHDNCRAALHWAISQAQAEIGLRLGGALWNYWLDRGFYAEGRALLASILQLEDAASQTPLRARVLAGLGVLSSMQGDQAEARAHLEEAAAIYRALGDEYGLATALDFRAEISYYEEPLDHSYGAEATALYAKVNDPIGIARMRQESGRVKYAEGDYYAAQAIFEQVLATYKTQQYEAGMGHTLCNLGRTLFQQQNFTVANQHFAAALQRAQARGDQGLVAYVLYFMGRTAYHQAEYAKAEPLLLESLRMSRELGVHAAHIALSLAFLGNVAFAQGDPVTAKARLGEGLTLAQQADDTYAVTLILSYFAALLTKLGESRRAVQLVAAGRALYQTLKIYLPPNDGMAFDAPLNAARPRLSPEQFDQAWAAGEQMTMDEAVALALA